VVFLKGNSLRSRNANRRNPAIPIQPKMRELFPSTIKFQGG
jgi:hypothetical protein